METGPSQGISKVVWLLSAGLLGKTISRYNLKTYLFQFEYLATNNH